jgi:pimeloyl-ACP methyl ester carboxylesterase
MNAEQTQVIQGCARGALTGEMAFPEIGKGAPAVYIHPLVGHAGQATRLPKNRRWIAIDLQGHGRTIDTDRPMTVEQHTDDIAVLLGQLKIDRADFFGDSFGGSIAVAIAIRHPRLVRKVVSYGSPLAPLPKELADRLTHDCDALAWDREEFGKVAPDPTAWPNMFAKSLKSGIEWKGLSMDELKSLKARVLIACGDKDLIPVERCAELSRIISDAQLAIIPDASHFVLFSEPDKLLPTIEAFLDEADSKVELSTGSSGYRPGKTR